MELESYMIEVLFLVLSARFSRPEQTSSVQSEVTLQPPLHFIIKTLRIYYLNNIITDEVIFRGV